MLKAFKIYNDCPFEQRPASIPLDWVWSSSDIPNDQQAAFESAGFLVLSKPDFIQYKADRQEAYDLWANTIDVSGFNEELRLYVYVQRDFKKLHPSKIDFRMHLQPNIYLQKNVTMAPNGRPQKATYLYNDELIAEIEFIFEVNPFNFMTRRIEKLAYYKNSGAKTEQWLIADDIYDVANPYHLREMMKERSEARAMIFEGVKAFLNGAFAAYYLPQGKTYAEILVVAGDLWNKYSNDIDAWVNVGSPRFNLNIKADTDFPILDFQIAAGVTLRNWILAQTAY